MCVKYKLQFRAKHGVYLYLYLYVCLYMYIYIKRHAHLATAKYCLRLRTATRSVTKLLTYILQATAYRSAAYFTCGHSWLGYYSLYLLALGMLLRRCYCCCFCCRRRCCHRRSELLLQYYWWCCCCCGVVMDIGSYCWRCH